MSNVVPASEIEAIVGIERHATKHYARAVSAEQTVYILHSQACRAEITDPGDCPWSIALDDGIDPAEWDEDAPVEVRVRNGRLLPRRAVSS